MGRKANSLPTILLHQQSGNARVRIRGKEYLLGPFGSVESFRRYGELIAQHLGGVTPVLIAKRETDPFTPNGITPAGSLTVNELVLAFMRHASTYYVDDDGKPNAEQAGLKCASSPLVELYGYCLVDNFTPLMLKAVREKYVALKWSRGFINHSINRVRRIFRWGVENGLTNTLTLSALEAVQPLKAGKTVAPDYERRESVPDESINAVRDVLAEEHRRLFDLLRYTGARPSELIGLRVSDIDKSGEVWKVELRRHKTAHYGKKRTIYFGPRSQSVLRSYAPNATIFPYRRDSFSTAVKRACLAVGVKPFVPYALRHTKATELRDTLGLEQASATLGHSQSSMTVQYSTKQDKLAIQAALASG